MFVARNDEGSAQFRIPDLRKSGAYESSSSFGIARFTRRPWARRLAGMECMQNFVKKPCESG
jgi:hypothetical protein